MFWIWVWPQHTNRDLILILFALILIYTSIYQQTTVTFASAYSLKYILVELAHILPLGWGGLPVGRADFVPPHEMDFGGPQSQAGNLQFEDTVEKNQ